MTDKRRIYQFQERVQVILASNMKNVNDPRIQDVTITCVKVSSDLKYAKIYYSCDENKLEEIQKGFESAKGFLRHILAESLNCRNVPEIKFFFDDSAQNYHNINNLLEMARLKDNISKSSREENEE